jgi:glycosyltransferase involved in cell wall biosynthesis
MASYQELLSERDRLKRRITELEARIRLLEGSTALVMARKLHGFRTQVLWLLKIALWAAKIRRRLLGSHPALPRPDMAVLDVEFPTKGLDPKRETVLLVSHDASLTGGPVLAWNIATELSKTFNVVSVLIQGGVLTKTFAEASSVVVGPLGIETHQAPRARKVAHQLARVYRPSFAIANTAESRYLAAPLAQEGIPVITLIHEFAASLFPRGTMQQAFDWSAEIVFPAAVVRDSFLPTYQSLFYKPVRILPQGQSVVPRDPALDKHDPNQPTKDALLKILRPEGRENAMLIVGMGPASVRKGTDLFIATAHIAKRLNPDADIRWAWIGSAHDDPMFLNTIGEQIHRSGLADDLVLVDTLDDIDTVYQAADLLFVSSRFDPLPNVAIDMLLRGKPVLCFDKATGIAEFVRSLPQTAPLAPPYLDIGKAAEEVVALEADRDTLKRMGTLLGEKARATFDMKRYVASLVGLAEEAIKAQAPRADNRALLLQPGNFDVPLYLGQVEGSPAQAEEVIDHYLNYGAQVGMSRRALAGFHPGIYADQVAEVNRAGWQDPLVHYIRAGRPAGPWAHPVLRLDTARPLADRGAPVALHGHFHYPDLIVDFVRALAVNDTVFDLFLTTGDEIKRGDLQAATGLHKGKVVIEIVPNRGRDIGPFLDVMRRHVVGNYDIVGHVHGKRSPHAHSLGPNVGDIWRVFLWEHLLGPQVPAADLIIDSLRAQEKIGLVFPEDPNIRGWDDNLDFAEDLARRMGMQGKLPKELDFPIGTMFWARPEALKPLVDLNLGWGDYPPEPLPLDGSMLHAMERLLPLVAQQAGFGFETTYLPGVGR